MKQKDTWTVRKLIKRLSELSQHSIVLVEDTEGMRYDISSVQVGLSFDQPLIIIKCK